SLSNCDDGANPDASLIFDHAGNLYGTTSHGGEGTVFEMMALARGEWTEKVVYTLCSLSDCDDGADPVASLIFEQAGNLYGTTYTGRLSNLGTVFELTPGANRKWTERVLHSFTGGNDGAYPTASLILDHAGNMYGTTSGGGNNGAGTAFELVRGANREWTER